VLEFTISSDPEAREVRYPNGNLSAEDLAFIEAQLREASELWEVEATFQANAMPWLRRGAVLELTGLLAEDDTPIPLQPALVVESTIRYAETAPPSLLGDVRAVWWEDA
jgi:hypothetical protein